MGNYQARKFIERRNMHSHVKEDYYLCITQLLNLLFYYLCIQCSNILLISIKVYQITLITYNYNLIVRFFKVCLPKRIIIFNITLVDLPKLNNIQK